MLATTENGSMKKVVYTKTKNKQFDAPHLPQEVLRHLPVVDNPHRPSGLFINRPALETLKSASTDRCFFLMIDVIFLKTMSTRISSLIGGPWLYMLLQPVAAHIVLILATTEDGSLKKVVYTKTKNRQFDAREVLECLLAVVNELRGLGIEDHLLAIVADEGTNNALLVEAGYPVLVDLHHLFKRMDTNMGYVDVVLQAVHKHAVFRQNNGAEKFATIRAMTDSIPAAARRRILFEIKEVERVVAQRFAVLDSSTSGSATTKRGEHGPQTVHRDGCSHSRRPNGRAQTKSKAPRDPPAAEESGLPPQHAEKAGPRSVEVINICIFIRK
ncbi:uncharacterized protein [Drosophila kikkawai]|uniref:MULE transposase domain-containing protein n=1 Tax=Drosophila kikkawai TaxID=30033 RepID=A0ABM4GI33_DROKI